MSEAPSARPAAAPRRRRRIPAAEVRGKMLAAARELVYATGVTVSLEDLSLEDVIRRAGVPRSSVYRIWPYKGDFIDDLLCHMAASLAGAAAFDPQTPDLVRKVITDHLDLLATAEGRRALMLETIRQGLAQNFSALVDSREWHIYIALVATAGPARDDQARDRIKQALGASEEAFLGRAGEFYRQMGQVFGLRLRYPAFGYDHLASAAASLVEGLALRHILARALVGAPDSGQPPRSALSLGDIISTSRPGPGIDGTPADWSLAATAFLGILDALTEPDPSNQPGQ
jgi:AcrR family transcriptional regulator